MYNLAVSSSYIGVPGILSLEPASAFLPLMMNESTSQNWIMFITNGNSNITTISCTCLSSGSIIHDAEDVRKSNRKTTMTTSLVNVNPIRNDEICRTQIHKLGGLPYSPLVMSNISWNMQKYDLSRWHATVDRAPWAKRSKYKLRWLCPLVHSKSTTYKGSASSPQFVREPVTLVH